MGNFKMESTTNNTKRAVKRRCGSVMVYYASPTFIACVLFKLIEFVLASNNDTQGTSIVFSDTSTYNLTHNTKADIEENNLQIENTSSGNNTNLTSTCEEEQEDMQALAFWLEGFVEIIISIVGLVTNSVAVPLLTSSKRLSSSFNRMLACLAVMDNVFLLTCFIEALRSYMVPYTNIHQLMFTYFFYPLQSISLMCSNNATVVLALERYLAVTRPVEYHINVTASGSSPWKRVMKYMIPTVLFSFLFNLSKFFEVTCLYHPVGGYDTSGNNITDIPLNITSTNYSDICQPQLTWLRRDPIYALWYVHVARLFVSGIIPFSLLVFLNVEVYRAVMKRSMGSAPNNRRTINQHPKNGSNSDQKRNNATSKHASSENAEEQKMAIVLFFIVALYLVSNTPRLILNFYEFFINEAFQESSKPSGCFYLPHWVLVTTSVSLVLITSNASTNFFIYCFVNTAFREELTRHGKVLIRRLRIDKVCNLASSCTKNNPEVILLTSTNDVRNKTRKMDGIADMTLATDLSKANTNKDGPEAVKEASNPTDISMLTEAVEHKSSCGLVNSNNGHNNPQIENGNDEAIHVDKVQPLKVSTISLHNGSDVLVETEKLLQPSQPETVVKIYCDYDAVRV